MEPSGALERGLTVLRVVTAAPERRWRATDLVQATGLARATVDRVLATLVTLGYLRADGRDVLLAPRLLELGAAYLAASGLPATLGPHAEALAEELDESVSLAVPDGGSVRFVARYTRRRTMTVALRVGDVLAAGRCAAGFVLLGAAVPWAVDDQLVEPGLVAVAMPVHEPGGEAVCAVSVISHTSRHTADGLREHALPHLRRAVAAMEAALRLDPPRRLVPGADLSRVPKDELGAAYLQSLARGLGVLVALGAAPGGLTLAEAAQVTGLARATVRRAVQTMERFGYVSARRARFVPLPRVLELGYAHLSALTLAEVVQPHLAALAERVRESASVAVLSGDDVVYVARVPTASIMSVDITLGTRFPAHATSMGRVLLAAEPAARLAALELKPLTCRTVTDPKLLAEAVRQAGGDGYALVDQELEDGVRSIAVPLRDGDGNVVAAVNVATHASRATTQTLVERVLPELTSAAARMTADLSHLPSYGSIS
ncbi:IclR family transcriptional regulator C-terminal domain-containing protein [Nonomuraea sp. NPDC059007]|uniref:IclR family transcriptional regulator domain-containing protein n=1 Tax=Nonomuraea sp. NPDC059007 TaxID=3346692 RepID=UPI0036854465